MELLRFVKNNRAPSRKCGAEPFEWIGLGLGGMLGLTNTISQTSTNAYNIHAQQAENQKQRDWQSAESQKQRDFESYEAQIAREFNVASQRNQFLLEFDRNSREWYKQQNYATQLSYANWLRQQQYLNDYNSPYAQVQRLQEAGFNPSAFGGQANMAQGLQSAPATQMSSSGTGGIPASVPVGAAAQGSASPLPHAINPMQSLRDIAAAYKDLEEGSVIKKRATAEIEERMAHAANLQSVTQLNDIEKYVKSKIKDVKVQQEFQQLKILQNQVILQKSLGNLQEAQACLNEMKSITEQIYQNKLVHEDELLCLNISTYNQRFRSEMAVLKSEENRNNASAGASAAEAFKLRAEGITENQLRDLREDSIRLNNEVIRAQGHGLRLDNWLKDETLQAQAKIVVERAKQAGLITQDEAYKLATHIYEYDCRKVNQFFNWLGQGAGAFRDFGIGSSVGSHSVKSTPVDSPWTIYGGSPATGF